jgi:glucose-1-phosphate adenylyltransferase
VQQNFGFIKRDFPDLVLILSGDHIYTMDYDPMVAFHRDHQADLTIGTFNVPIEEASRFGVLATDDKYRVTSFLEKPKNPPSTLANMGVYLFNRELLDRVLWEDKQDPESAHDFGKNIIPKMVASDARVYAYPYTGYWMDVGTYQSYWQAHMDMLSPTPKLKLYNRDWIIHTRTEEYAPARLPAGARVYASMICNGCYIGADSIVESSVISPGVVIRPGAVVRESIICTDTVIESGAVVERAIVDKRAHIYENARVGWGVGDTNIQVALVGKNCTVPAGYVVEPDAQVGTDVIESDYDASVITSGTYIQTRRKPNEIV